MQEFNSDNIENYLISNGVKFERTEHAPVFTVEEAKNTEIGLSGTDTKNLFLRDKKGNRHFLVVAEAEQKIDLKDLASKLEQSKLSFASAERLNKFLKVEPGSVSILAIFNDHSKSVDLIVDESVWASEKILAHPLVNTATLSIDLTDLKDLLASNSIKVLVKKL